MPVDDDPYPPDHPVQHTRIYNQAIADGMTLLIRIATQLETMASQLNSNDPTVDVLMTNATALRSAANLIEGMKKR